MIQRSESVLVPIFHFLLPQLDKAVSAWVLDL